MDSTTPLSALHRMQLVKNILAVFSQSIGLSIVWAFFTIEILSAIFPISRSNGLPALWEYEASALVRAVLYVCISYICAQRLGPIVAFFTAFGIVFVVDTGHWTFSLFGISNTLPHYVDSLIFAMFAGLIAPAVSRFNVGRTDVPLRWFRLLAAFVFMWVLGYSFTYVNYLIAVWFGGEEMKTSAMGWYFQANLFVSLLLAITASVSAALILNSSRALVLLCVLFLTPWIIYLSPKLAYVSASSWQGIVLACVTFAVGVSAGVLSVAWRTQKHMIAG